MMLHTFELSLSDGAYQDSKPETLNLLQPYLQFISCIACMAMGRMQHRQIEHLWMPTWSQFMNDRLMTASCARLLGNILGS